MLSITEPLYLCNLRFGRPFIYFKDKIDKDYNMKGLCTLRDLGIRILSLCHTNYNFLFPLSLQPNVDLRYFKL